MPIRFRMIRGRSRAPSSRAAMQWSDFDGTAHFNGAMPLRRCSRTGVYGRFGGASRSRVVDTPCGADRRQRAPDRVEHRIPCRPERRDEGKNPSSPVVRPISGQPAASLRTSSRCRLRSMSMPRCACRSAFAMASNALADGIVWMRYSKLIFVGRGRAAQSNPCRGIPSLDGRATGARRGGRPHDHRSCRFLLSSIVSNSSYCALGCWSAPGAW